MWNANLGTGEYFCVKYKRIVFLAISCSNTTAKIGSNNDIIAFVGNGFKPSGTISETILTIRSPSQTDKYYVNTRSSFTINTSGYVRQNVTGEMAIGSRLFVLFIYKAAI